MMPVYRYNDQFELVDYQNINIDSRGLVQNPVDGNLYMKNYITGSFIVLIPIRLMAL